jgi:hypothetical protein
MIQRLNLRTVPEEADQADITARYEALLAVYAEVAGSGTGTAAAAGEAADGRRARSTASEAEQAADRDPADARSVIDGSDGADR